MTTIFFFKNTRNTRKQYKEIKIQYIKKKNISVGRNSLKI
jgi:hypothetical protein